MHEQITQLIYKAIDQINKQNPETKPVSKKITTVLYGSNSELDSLSLINLIVATEQQVEEEFQFPITLADDRALSQEVSPFTTVATLAGYVETLIKERADA